MPLSAPAAHHAAHMDLRPMPLLESPGTKAARDATPNDEHQSQIVPAPLRASAYCFQQDTTGFP
jgi:hypothetical protein